jgi:ankyrin repeat protein
MMNSDGEKADAMDNLLRKAVQSGSVGEIVAAVQRGADINARDEGGETALTYATSVEWGPERARECVRALIGLGARVSEEQPDGGLGTSVHQAAAHGYTEALRELLSADGKVALNTFDDMSRTPLICAVDNGRLVEASLLLDAGADVDANDSEKIGNTALIHAVRERNLPMVKLLVTHGADPTIPGWMQLSALDRARDWAVGSPAPALREIFELLESEAKRRKRI